MFSQRHVNSLCKAVVAGDFQECQSIVGSTNPRIIMAQETEGGVALHHAAAWGRPDMLRWFLSQKGVDCDVLSRVSGRIECSATRRRLLSFAFVFCFCFVLLFVFALVFAGPSNSRAFC
eukprot:m.673022 g.673022  ORF g.673022 m.673022 type:complete len:119 (-) comp58537_c0_seq26:1373-1729(-)